MSRTEELAAQLAATEAYILQAAAKPPGEEAPEELQSFPDLTDVNPVLHGPVRERWEADLRLHLHNGGAPPVSPAARAQAETVAELTAGERAAAERPQTLREKHVAELTQMRAKVGANLSSAAQGAFEKLLATAYSDRARGRDVVEFLAAAGTPMTEAQTADFLRGQAELRHATTAGTVPPAWREEGYVHPNELTDADRSGYALAIPDGQLINGPQAREMLAGAKAAGISQAQVHSYMRYMLQGVKP